MPYRATLTPDSNDPTISLLTVFNLGESTIVDRSGLSGSLVSGPVDDVISAARETLQDAGYDVLGDWVRQSRNLFRAPVRKV